MTNFPPETYLAAARIAYPEYEWRVYHPSLAPPIIVHGVAPELWQFTKDLEGADYRALREALDKEYGIVIFWDTDRWCSYPNSDQLPGNAIVIMTDEDITTLMLKNVQALIKAGVAE